MRMMERIPGSTLRFFGGWNAIAFDFFLCVRPETITAVFKTDYQVDFPYDPQELFIYALIGVFGGLSGALFVWCHRQYVLFMRKNKKISSFLQKKSVPSSSA